MSNRVTHHSSGALPRHHLGSSPPLPFPPLLPPPRPPSPVSSPPSIYEIRVRAYKEAISNRKKIKFQLVRIFPIPLCYTRFQAVSTQLQTQLTKNTSAWRRVTTKLPVSKNFLVGSLAVVTNMPQEYLMSTTRSPGVIADLRADAYRTALRVLGVSRPDDGPISQSQLIHSGVTLCPRSDGGGPSNVTTLTVMSRDGFFGPAGRQLSLLLPSWAQMNASCLKAFLSP
jgi:hypothetical protein